VALRPDAGDSIFILEDSRSQKTRHIRYDSSARVISQKQRPLSDNTQQSQQTDIHVPGGIRNRNPSRRTVADPRLKLRGHWDRPLFTPHFIHLRNVHTVYLGSQHDYENKNALFP
jgi:hypothetical protein